ncbi:unnamed protein product [Symbiodinium natans]|uniref:TLDc domain-containing protein n=1 Tax=Symbiodinium natans TaxID=878477 RepID=A0A812U8A2_9DINO|nr:unnamed protein product [Symbiodinium natans]
MNRVFLLFFAFAGSNALKATRAFLNATNKTVLTKDISDLEDTVHQLLQQEATPSLANFAKDLQKIIDDDMKAAVLKVKASLQTELDGHYTTGYDKCDSTMLGSGEVSSKSSVFTAAASQHETCRKEEAEAETAFSTCSSEESSLKTAKDSACKVVADYDKISNGNCGKNSGEDYVAYTARLMKYYEAENKKGKEAEAKCDEATKVHNSKSTSCSDLKSAWTTKKAACDKQQDTMDAASCEIQSTSENVCKVYDDCYSSATSSYNNDKTSVGTQEAAIKNEWKALLHLECLLKVFALSDTEKANAMKACNSKNYDSEANSALTLTYPSPVPRDAKACPPQGSVESKALVAGRDNYKAKYYQLPSNAPSKTCTAACCATCDSFTCPDGYVQKSNAASIFGELRDLCCDSSRFSGSKILKTKAWEDTLVGWLPSNLKSTNWVPCYRKSTRTSNGQWWNKCRSYANTLTVMKLSTGKVIGGFSKAGRGHGSYTNQNTGDSWLFSLTNGFKHNVCLGRAEKLWRFMFGEKCGDGAEDWTAEGRFEVPGRVDLTLCSGPGLAPLASLI